MTRFLLLVLASSLPGCAALAVPPFLIQNDFHEKRAALKADWKKELIPKEAARDACLKMLQQADGKHAAPPPYPDEICDFGSFADRRYELTIALEQGSLSQESWKRECLAFQPRPDGDQDCAYDPVGERVRAWKAAVARGVTTKEAAQYDCERFLKERPSATEAKKDKVCEF